MKRFFFVHIMKTAGTTFALQLRAQFRAEAIYPAHEIDWHDAADLERYTDASRALAVSPARRSQIEFYTGHFPYMVAGLIDPALVVITLLREPVARTVSVLDHFQRLDDRYRGLTLEQIYDDDHVFHSFVSNHQTAFFARTPQDGEQWIRDPIEIDDARFARAKANLANVDVMGLTEDYERFIDELRARFGWWPNGLNLDERANVGGYSSEIDDGLLERIAHDNRYDIELYQFAQELLTNRRRSPAEFGR
jgi:hypothetical protein